MRSVLLALLAVMMFIAAPATLRAQGSSFGDAVETVGQGTINWTSGQIYATGIGVPPTNAVNAAQSRAMAVRAAQVVALRNLLEIVKGVRVDSETVVENFMTKSDVIRTRVDGIVRGAMVVKTAYLSDGSVEVTVGMGIKGALLDTVLPDTFRNRSITPVPLRPAPSPPPPAPPVVRPAPPERRPQPQRPAPIEPAPVPAPPGPEQRPEPRRRAPVPALPEQSTAQFKGGKATGVVIDGRGLGLRPALLPKIVDSQGQEIYVGQVVTRTNAVEQGVAGYAKDVTAAENNFRVTDNPAVLKGLRASGAARTDIVLGQADAEMLRKLATNGDFLQFCRVIIVY